MSDNDLTDARQQQVRLLLLSALMPAALAQAQDTGVVDAAAAHREWMAWPGTSAPGVAHPTHTVRVAYESLERWASLPQVAPGNATLTALWQALALDGELLVLIEGPSPDADLADWTHQLTAEPQVTAVAFEGRASPTRVLQWPLRIGTGPGAAGTALRIVLMGGHFEELYRLADANAGEVDLWLATESPAAAAAAPRADCAALLVLGDAGPGLSHADLTQLQQEAGVAAFAACSVPSGEWGPWFQALVRELAHDRPLPAALFAAAKADGRRWGGPDRPMADLPAPAVVGDGDFLLSTSRISATAVVLGRALADVALDALQPTSELQRQVGFDGSASIGEAFAQRAAGFTFRNEEGDATALVRIHREVESQHGPLLTGDGTGYNGMPRMEPVEMSAPYEPSRPDEVSPPDEGFAHAEPPRDEEAAHAQPPRDEEAAGAEPPGVGDETGVSAPAANRHVQAKLLHPDGHDASAEPMAPARDYRLSVHIGPRVEGVRIISSVPLDESTLPPSEDGHLLAIAYFPLSRLDDADSAPPPPQRAQLRLPPSGDSAPVEFALQPGQSPARFRARLVVTFANRVLQTLVLEAAAGGLLQLREENAYQNTLAPDPETRPAQVAFVINDDPQGRPGLATLMLDSSSFVDSGSLAAEIAAISLVIQDANEAAVGTALAFDDADSVRRLRGLAMHGSALLAEVQRAHGVAPLAASTHVQLVEAVAEAFFPIEFLYDGEPPLPHATLCPNARAALADPTVHAGCPHAASEDHVCPAQFWGLSKCIERLPARPPVAPAAPTAGDAPTVPPPEPSVPGRLGPFKRALLGASSIAKRQMRGDDGLPARVRASVPQVVVAADWKDWKLQVGAVSPDLMILLPHSLVLADVPNMAALEISLAELPSSSVRPSYVRGPLPPGPMVLLLGCSTVLTKAPFLNFVRHFQQAGAPVVVGTLAKIHVTQAATIAARFLDLVDAGAQPRRFDEVLLDFKRRLLGEGNQGVLALVSYGHASWEI